jgi:hypothetical protein
MNNTVTPTLHAEKAPDYRPLGYADPVPSAVMSREGRKHPWNAHTAKAVLALKNGHQVIVSGGQIVILLDELARTYPAMKPRNVLRTLTVDELRAILTETAA